MATTARGKGRAVADALRRALNERSATLSLHLRTQREAEAKQRLPALPSVATLLRLYDVRAKKELSQNFLLNPVDTGDPMCGVSPKGRNEFCSLDRIATVARCHGSTVIEIGAGPGNLTRSILRAGATCVLAVEKDLRFEPALMMLAESVHQEGSPWGDVRIVMEDMLKLDERMLLHNVAEPVSWDTGTPRVCMVGNLPFGVATELLLKWLRLIPGRDGPFYYGRVPMTLLFQKEVGERIAASPGGRAPKTYGRLSVLTQNWCHVHRLFDLPAKAFTPAPEVDGVLLSFTPRTHPLFEVPFDLLEETLRLGFNQRRKTMRQVAKNLLGGEGILGEARVNPRARAEEIPISGWVRLAQAYGEHTNDLYHPSL